MADETKQWEYRVQTIGSVFGTKDENIQTTLDDGDQKAGKRLTFTHPMAVAK